jgi:hypothetical protein
LEKEARQRLERLTQQARRLLEQEFREQLEGRYDILLDGRIPLAPGAHLSPRECVVWEKLVAAVAHKRSLLASAKKRGNLNRPGGQAFRFARRDGLVA